MDKQTKKLNKEAPKLCVCVCLALSISFLFFSRQSVFLSLFFLFSFLYQTLFLKLLSPLFFRFCARARFFFISPRAPSLFLSVSFICFEVSKLFPSFPILCLTNVYCACCTCRCFCVCLFIQPVLACFLPSLSFSVCTHKHYFCVCLTFLSLSFLSAFIST
jgi:hypothetical protein